MEQLQSKAIKALEICRKKGAQAAEVYVENKSTPDIAPGGE